MLFNSFTYILFLPIVALIYWYSPQKLRHTVLLLASYIFYMSWMPKYGLLLLALSALNYGLGIWLANTQEHKTRRLVFIAGATLNLGCLVLFKYTNFFIDSIREASCFAAKYIHTPVLDLAALPDLPIILPLGISFFVFEFIHYLVDVFKGAKPMKSPIKFGLFAAFFPSQIAGPIKRFQDFEEQLSTKANFQKERFQSGIALIMQGMFKKVVLGDNLAPLVQAGFAEAQAMGTFDTWLCVFAFAFQIYYDFSGYTDIGRGSALVLGFKLPENFDMPYTAKSLKEFWHRWHISLSTWLRDYLFIPLGGSRHGNARAAANLITTMLLGGLWHGASWHYVAWGGYQGIGLAINRVFDAIIARNSTLNAASKTLWWNLTAQAVTFIVVCIGWVVFRANNMGEALSIYSGMFCLRPSTCVEATVSEMFWQSSLPVALTLYAMAYQLTKHYPRLQSILPADWNPLRTPIYAKAIAVAGFALVVLGLAPQRSIPFIYFQF